MEIEELRECRRGSSRRSPRPLGSFSRGGRPAGTFMPWSGVYPPRRVIRRHSLELKKMKEQGYMAEVFTQQLRIEQDKFTIAMINAGDGADYDLAKANQKDVIFCGAPNEDIMAVQEAAQCRDLSRAPGAGERRHAWRADDFLAFEKSKTPTLVLDVGNDTTHSFIVSASGVEASRPIPQGFEAMVPVVQKELGLKDEESARGSSFARTASISQGWAPADQAAAEGAPVLDRLLRGPDRPVGRAGDLHAALPQARLARGGARVLAWNLDPRSTRSHGCVRAR
jgi:hypothetical protein